MLTRQDDVDAHALHRQGWTISAIARHLGHDRKTIRAYLKSDRVAGQRRPAGPDPFEPFVTYCPRAAGRGSASVGADAVRRGRCHWLRPLVSDVHPAVAHPRPAAALRALCTGSGPGVGSDRAPAR
jgi:transposase